MLVFSSWAHFYAIFFIFFAISYTVLSLTLAAFHCALQFSAEALAILMGTERCS